MEVQYGGGNLVAQADGLPLGGTFPFRLWRPGAAVRDLRYIALPQGIDLCDHAIGVGIYRRDTGYRASAVDSGGDSLIQGTYRLDIGAS